MIYAGCFRRLAAIIIDIILLWIVCNILLKSVLGPADGVSAMIGSTIIHLGYTIGLLGLIGQTIGKKLLNVQVVMVDGSKITWPAAFLRYALQTSISVLMAIAFWPFYSKLAALANVPAQHQILINQSMFTVPTYSWIIFGVCLIVGFIDPLVMLFNARRRTLHDFIAGTVVVVKIPN